METSILVLFLWWDGFLAVGGGHAIPVWEKICGFLAGEDCKQHHRGYSDALDRL